ncbi:hypothetical protein [Marinicella sp. W31]|uniref:hypothetical protein n=1 Tax=Marinicella sp. W31 TaxID=3023713 RepID=UPI0037584C68
MDTLLMLDKTEERLIPINELFLQVAQYSKQQELNEKYCGNLIIYPDGGIKHMTEVKVLGFFGTGFVTKLLSRVNATYSIHVDLTEVEESWSSILERARTYLANDLASADPYMPEQAELSLDDQEIFSAEVLYASLVLPEFDECLDIMI